MPPLFLCYSEQSMILTCYMYRLWIKWHDGFHAFTTYGAATVKKSRMLPDHIPSSHRRKLDVVKSANSRKVDGLLVFLQNSLVWHWFMVEIFLLDILLTSSPTVNEQSVWSHCMLHNGLLPYLCCCWWLLVSLPGNSLQVALCPVGQHLHNSKRLAWLYIHLEPDT